jgi:hypothetical protein
MVCGRILIRTFAAPSTSMEHMCKKKWRVIIKNKRDVESRYKSIYYGYFPHTKVSLNILRYNSTNNICPEFFEEFL